MGNLGYRLYLALVNALLAKRAKTVFKTLFFKFSAL